MAKYPLQALLTARLFREEGAKRDVRTAQAALEEARERARRGREKLEEYGKWRPGEEARLFEEIRGKEIPLSGVDGHREDVQALRMEELRLEEECMTLDRAVEAAEAGLAAARERQFEAIKARSKIEEHRNRWVVEERKRIEAAEEAELEEFTGGLTSFENEDGDGYE